MKTLKLMLLFMAATAMSLATSCGKDEEEKAPADPSGTYTGKITVMSTPSSATAVVEKTGDTYSLLLKNLNIAPFPGVAIPIGDAAITNITYANGVLGGGTPLSRDVTLPDVLVSNPMLGITDPEITVKVSLVSGTVLGNNLKFTLNVITGIAVMNTVAVDFDGNK
jgi:hypothetical protein